MCVFSAAKPPKKHTLVLFEAAGGGLKKNILFRTRYLANPDNYREPDHFSNEVSSKKGRFFTGS